MSWVVWGLYRVVLDPKIMIGLGLYVVKPFPKKKLISVANWTFYCMYGHSENKSSNQKKFIKSKLKLIKIFFFFNFPQGNVLLDFHLPLRRSELSRGPEGDPRDGRGQRGHDLHQLGSRWTRRTQNSDDHRPLRHARLHHHDSRLSRRCCKFKSNNHFFPPPTLFKTCFDLYMYEPNQVIRNFIDAVPIIKSKTIFFPPTHVHKSSSQTIVFDYTYIFRLFFNHWINVHLT